MPDPNRSDRHAALRLAMGELDDVLTPANCAQMAGLLTKLAGGLCAMAAADEPVPELMAQVFDAACKPATPTAPR